jgi:hypothetical protein
MSAAEIDSEEPMARAAPVDPARSREFNDAEEDYHYGRPEFDEGGAPVGHVSPWLGFQALGIATAVVVGSAGLGIFGAAKYLGVSSVSRGFIADRKSRPEGLRLSDTFASVITLPLTSPFLHS